VGLAHAAARAGALVHQNAAVIAIDRIAHGRFRLKTAQATIEADQVLLATGASQEGPFGWFRRRIVPVGSFIIVTESLGAVRAAAIMPGRRTCTSTQNIGNYFRLSADHRLVFGGRARFAMSSPKSDLKSGAILRSQLHEVFPQLSDVRTDYCWGGLVDMTRDRLPRAGTRDGMHYAMGYSGHGVQMSTYMGDLMARRITGEDAPILARSGLASDPVPFRQALVSARGRALPPRARSDFVSSENGPLARAVSRKSAQEKVDRQDRPIPLSCRKLLFGVEAGRTAQDPRLRRKKTIAIDK
jgi:glycine/D-amino acid oxidase-like deaminating enzyme